MNNHQLDTLRGFARIDAALDEALAESFPASDPVAISFPHAVALPPAAEIDPPTKTTVWKMVEASRLRGIVVWRLSNCSRRTKSDHYMKRQN